MKITNTKIPGCYELNLLRSRDERGSFTKTYHKGIYQELGLKTEFAEEYYTISQQGVLRGLHFQIPPQDHTKLVYCVQGKVLDVVVDLRIGSPTFGNFATFHLSGHKAKMILIPPGLAHGFYVQSEQAILMYKVSTVYSAEHDSGVLWNSLGIPWPDTKPILSQRDRLFLPFSEFISPFTYKECD